jgi:hypothetical protein
MSICRLQIAVNAALARIFIALQQNQLDDTAALDRWALNAISSSRFCCVAQ